MTMAASLLLLAGILVYVFYPERNVEAQTQKSRLDFLLERKDVLYENLRDLNFEYRAGKFLEEDYAGQRAAMENETAEVLAEIDVLESAARPARGLRQAVK